jgi:hypothetical protein
LLIVKNSVLITLVIASVLFTACDSFRRLAGRPTSADIAIKKARIELEEAAHQARLDSLRTIQKAMADSLELLDSVRASKTMITKGSSVRGLSLVGLDFRYYVVVGTFGSPANAKHLASRASAAGYQPTLIPFNNGFTAVGLEGCDKMAVCLEALQKIKGESFCPKDVWILVNE